MDWKAKYLTPRKAYGEADFSTPCLLAELLSDRRLNAWKKNYGLKSHILH